MTRQTIALVAAGAFACTVLAVGSTMAHGPQFIARLDQQASAALATVPAPGVVARFFTGPVFGPQRWLTRHPVLGGGTRLEDAVRGRAALAVAAVPGVGGVRWAPRRGVAVAGAMDDGQPVALHCQQDVDAILKARSIRFAEASAALDPASSAVLDEVAAALRPCVGSIIAITGHTDGAGDAAANLALSRQRAEAVRRALEGRGIPADGLRAQGFGATRPLAGLRPDDPANRRIEFSVIATMPQRPTPIDTPGAG